MTDRGFDEAFAFARSRVGSTLNGKWRLDRLLGVGGMAAVYEATHRNRKRAAVKLLHPEFSLNPAVRERFLREGYVANSVGHTGAVAVDDDDVTEDGCAFLVMELLDGETLDARWERKGKHLPAAEVLSLMDQVLSTLIAAHSAGIVHRDLKPENLFLTRSGVVKVLDFGIARVRELGQSSSKTQTGSMLGTPSFMPPEQARGRWDEVDAQSDIWAIGATMFTLLSGHYVHEASTVNEALAFAVTQRARSIATLLPDLAFPVVELVDRALEYERPSRWSSVTNMQGALRRAYAGLEAAAIAAGAPPLKPITIETFDDETVAIAEVGSNAVRSAETHAEASLQRASSTAGPELDIPPSPTPRAKAATLTTSRGVERGSTEPSQRTRRRFTYGVGAALVLACLLVATWLGGRRPQAPSDKPASDDGSPHASRAAGAPGRSTTEHPSRDDTPAHISLDDLPMATAPDADSGQKVRTENHEPTVRVAPSASGGRGPIASRPANARRSTSSDDPFASRQ